jgi:CheY-like chemotaxis protein
MAGEQIVIIDDDPDICEALSMILGPAGYRLTCCATGPQGLATIAAQPPDLILLDIMLSSPSEGLQVARELRQREASRRIPIIMISAYRATLGTDYAKEFGGDYTPPERFLDKPLMAETLLRAVAETLQGKKEEAAEKGDAGEATG